MGDCQWPVKVHHFGGVSNVLRASMQTTVAPLHSLGHSIRSIARQLGINRRTARRYIGASDVCLEGSKCTTSEPKVATGSRSRCEPWREVIEAAVNAGLTAERIICHSFYHYKPKE